MLQAHQQEYFNPTTPASSVILSPNALEFPLQQFFGLCLHSGMFFNTTLAQQHTPDAEPTAIHGSLIYMPVPQHPLIYQPIVQKLAYADQEISGTPTDGPDHQEEPTASLSDSVIMQYTTGINSEDRCIDLLMPPGLVRQIPLPEVMGSADSSGSEAQEQLPGDAGLVEEEMELQYPSPKQDALNFIHTTAFRSPSPTSETISTMDWAQEEAISETQTAHSTIENSNLHVPAVSLTVLSPHELNENKHLIHGPPTQYGARKPYILLTRGWPIMRTLSPVKECSLKHSQSAESELESISNPNEAAEELSSALNYAFTQNAQVNSSAQSSLDAMPALKWSCPDDFSEGQSSSLSVSHLADTGLQPTGVAERGTMESRDLEQGHEARENMAVNPANLVYNHSPNITVFVETTVTQSFKTLTQPPIDLPETPTLPCKALTQTPMNLPEISALTNEDLAPHGTQGHPPEWSRYLQSMLFDETLLQVHSELTDMLGQRETPEWTTASPFPTRVPTPSLSETSISLSTTHSASSEESLLFTKPSASESPVIHVKGIEASGPLASSQSLNQEIPLGAGMEDYQADDEKIAPPETQDSDKDEEDSEMPDLISEATSEDIADESSTSSSEYSPPGCPNALPIAPPILVPRLDPRVDFAKANWHAHTMFNILLKLGDSHPSQSFVEVQTDCPDIWGFNDADGTIIIPAGAPLPPTTLLPIFSTKPPVGHPLTWLVGGDWTQQARVSFKYTGPVDNQPPQSYDNAYTDELDNSYGVWKNDGDLEISQHIIWLCTSVHQEILTPEMWDFEHHGTTYETMQESLRTIHNQVLPTGVHLMRKTHRCSTMMDPQIINPQVEPFPSGDILKPEEYEAAFGRNPWVTHFSSPFSYGKPNWMFNPWLPYITYLHKARMETKFILQVFKQIANTSWSWTHKLKTQHLALHPRMFFSMMKKMDFSIKHLTFLQLWDRVALLMPSVIFASVHSITKALYAHYWFTKCWNQTSILMEMVSAGLWYGVKKIGETEFTTKELYDCRFLFNSIVFIF
ncbi:hypothetical protein BDN71DRAFT_1431453 [Pleurotus eryngii]|uniref:Uncharacterized protein n=1 Tax=Pleurotus eryngii TaxID=5323 RepID=A0A9P5ZVN8_PLEER|nr:hypothetical protein BDN71DRAFT_1431453 [Pleurotus eryngii]